MGQNLTPLTTVNHQDKNRPVILISVLAVLIIVIFRYFFLYQKPNSVPQNIQVQNTNTSTTSEQLADQNTYQNDEYGFEIKLPQGWSTETDNYFKSPVFISPETKKTAEENCKPRRNCTPELPSFDIVFNNLDFQYKDYVEPSKIVEIGTNKWTRYLGDDLLATTHYILMHNDKIFNFGVVGGSNENVLKEILFTFKFIEPSLINSSQGDKIGYIKKVYKNNNKYYIDFDEIQFFLGDRAIEAKKSDGICEVTEGRDCFTPTGYYIRNKDTSIKPIEISSNTKVFVLSDCYKLTESGLFITIDQFVNNFGSKIACSYPGASSFYVPDNSPYWIKLNSNETIEKITEQYIP